MRLLETRLKITPEPAAIRGRELEFAAMPMTTIKRIKHGVQNDGLKSDNVTALLAAIVESSDDAIVSKTLEGVITSWNSGSTKMFGYSAAEAIGQHITLIIPAERRAEENDVLAHIRRGEKIDHFETVRQAKNGRKVEVSLTVSPVRDSGGRIIGASKVARDITERKQADDDRARLTAQEQAARRAAEEASRLRDDFLATVSHELRNPLNSIMGWAGLLRSGKLDAKTSARGIDAIMRAVQAQDKIISDLLDVSRIISGRLRLGIKPVDLVELLESVIDTMRPAVEAKQIRMQAMLDPAAGSLAGDPDRLRQVFWNLLSNAVKFTPKDGRIQILTHRLEQLIEIVISDTGIGIETPFLPHVFDRFRQGDSGINRRSSGLGLGLSIVRNLVELHGGTVRVESEGIGHGASFTVRLPILVVRSFVEEKKPIDPTVEGITPVEDGPSLKDLKVLVVDDAADAREVASAVLIQAQAEVRTAESARAALEVMDVWRPDILVADIGMPGEDGYALIRQVRGRSQEKGGAIPAAALTAYTRTQDSLRVLSEGYQMHIPKPIRPNELVAVVASLSQRFK